MKHLCYFLVLTFVVVSFSTTILASDKVISYQGLLTDNIGDVVPDSDYQLDFMLYTDSVAGSVVWAENASITTSDGIFAHLIGSVNQLTADLFSNYDNLYLEIRINEQAILPRSLLTASGYAFSAGQLSSIDDLGISSIETNRNEHSLTIFDSTGENLITLRNKPGDSAVILPDSAINSDEILNETGFTLSTDINLYTLSTSEMLDLTDLTITIPDDGYIVLYGKCYLLLSGTTGANTAIIQIDENEGGGTQFPYYAIAGLSGYVNSGTNYFPIMVTRVYYKQKGTYSFRLEGKANNQLPAVAQSWDHVISAFYYSTTYHGVEAIVSDPFGFNNPKAVERIQDKFSDSNKTYYKVDLRELEIRDKEAKKQ